MNFRRILLLMTLAASPLRVEQDGCCADQTWYYDGDGDGYGDPADSMEACEASAGYVAVAGDCDDTRPDVYPEAPDCGDGAPGAADNDCDGAVDEDLASTSYPDMDGDGYGDTAQPTEACVAPAGHSEVGGDCDDADADLHPNKPEACNLRDDDCDGAADEGLDPSWRLDADGDGFGSEDAVACEEAEGYLRTRGDCDDADPAIHAGAPDDLGDGIDSDCGGTDFADPHLGFGAGSLKSIAEAFTWAPDGGTVWLGPGVYPGEAATIRGVDLRIASTHGAEQTEIRGGSASLIRLEDGNLTVEDLTLSGAVTQQGGAIQVVRGSLVASGLRLLDNTTSGKGGAIALSSADGRIARSHFEGNVASQGGGVWVNGGSLLVSDSTFVDNEGLQQAGAVYVDRAWGQLRSTQILRNRSGGSAGGVAFYSFLSTTDLGPSGLVDCVIESNEAAGDGGGVWALGEYNSPSMVIEDTAVLGNRSGGKGGGIILLDRGILNLDRVRIAANAAVASGGGLYVSSYQALNLSQVVIADNLAVTGGGFFTTRLDRLSTVNSAFAYNLPDNLATASLTAAPGIRYSMFTGGEGPGLTNVDALPGSNLVEGSPGFVKLLLDRRIGDDFLLLPGSMLRDVGDPAILDPDGSRSDIGAFGGPHADWRGYADLDGDGLYDPWEREHGIQPGIDDDAADPDGDALTNQEEFFGGTHPSLTDTDGDGASDGDERRVLSDPLDLYRRPGQVYPATVRVPEDVVDLRTALGAIVSEGRITLGAGSWPGGEFALGVRAAITGGGPEVCHIEGGGGPVLTGLLSSVELTGLSLSGGEGSAGGGLALWYGEGHLRDVVVEGNVATGRGGGIYAYAAPLTLEDTIVSTNEAGLEGGGIYTYTAPLTLDGSIVSSNVAGQAGGGVYTNGGALSIVGSAVDNNTAGTEGGGIYHRGVVFTASDTAVVGNIAGLSGGGIDSGSAGDLSLADVHINGNTAETTGGGLKIYGKTSVTLIDVEVGGNGAGTDGGGIHMERSTFTAAGLSVFDNRAAGGGGGLYLYWNTGEIQDAAVSQNEARFGGGLCLVGVLKAGGMLVDGNTAVEDGGGLGIYGTLTADGPIQLSGNAADVGGGGSFHNADDAFDGALIEGNLARQGAGVQLSSSQVTGAWIEGNVATGGGGGAYLVGGSSRVTASVVVNNQAVSGGGIAVYGGNVSSSWVGGNRASDLGGGLYVSETSTTLDHVALVGNQARAGGGLYGYLCRFTLREMVAVANTCQGPGAGIYLNASDPSTLEGSIVAFNSTQNTAGPNVFVKNSVLNARFSTLHGGITGVTSDATVLTDDPQLRSVPAPGVWRGADLHLALGSPAINSGRSTEVDADGGPADQGIYGARGGATWDNDRDGVPVYFWPGAYDDAPVGVDTERWEEDDWPDQTP